MDKSAEEACIKICEKWNKAAILKKNPETVKKIFAVLDLIEGTKLESQISIASKFLKTITQNSDVKEVRDYVKKRKEIDGGYQLF